MYGCKNALWGSSRIHSRRHAPLVSLFISETSDWPSIELSHALSNEDGEEEGTLCPDNIHKGAKLWAIHQWTVCSGSKTSFSWKPPHGCNISQWLDAASFPPPPTLKYSAGLYPLSWSRLILFDSFFVSGVTAAEPKVFSHVMHDCVMEVGGPTLSHP